MPTKKRAAKKHSARTSKYRATAAKVSSRSSTAKNGPVPPYGPPIHEAIARGDLSEMRKLAASTRRWLRDVQAALNGLEKSIAKLS